MQPITFTCNSCEQVAAVDITEAPLADGGVRQALICTSCQAQYPIAVITAYGLRLRTRLSRLRRAGKSGTAQYRSTLARYQREVTRMAATDEP